MAESIYITVGKDLGAFERTFVGKMTRWPVKKGARKGDVVYFLIGTQFQAHGSVASNTETPGTWGKSPKIFREVDNIRMLPISIPLAVFREAIPKWKWCNSRQPIQTSVPNQFQASFLEIIRNPPVPSDFDEPAEKVLAETYRFIRDSPMTKRLKAKYGFRCQVKGCPFALQMQSGRQYIEAHHLKPLHQGGPDQPSNILILCPNHHALFDYRIPVFETASRIRIGDKTEKLHKHDLAKKYIEFHNSRARQTF